MEGKKAKLELVKSRSEIVAILRRPGLSAIVQGESIDKVQAATTSADLIAAINAAIVRYSIAGKSRGDLQAIKADLKALRFD